MPGILTPRLVDEVLDIHQNDAENTPYVNWPFAKDFSVVVSDSGGAVAQGTLCGARPGQ